MKTKIVQWVASILLLSATSAAMAGNLVFEAQEEEEIIISTSCGVVDVVIHFAAMPGRLGFGSGMFFRLFESIEIRRSQTRSCFRSR